MLCSVDQKAIAPLQAEPCVSKVDAPGDARPVRTTCRVAVVLVDLGHGSRSVSQAGARAVSQPSTPVEGSC
jgi:hypothetical protein